MSASASQSASAPAPRHESHRSMFIRGANVLDETGGFVGPMDVVVEHGVVVASGGTLSPGARKLRSTATGCGCCLASSTATSTLVCRASTPSSCCARRSRDACSRRPGALRRTLSAGVTFVRDAGIAEAGVRDAVAAGLVPGPTMQVSVVAIGSTGGHLDGFLDRSRPRMLGGLLDAGLPGPAAASRRRSRGDAKGRPPRSSLRGRLDQARCHKRRVGDIRRWVRPGALASRTSPLPCAEAGCRRRPVMVHALGGDAIGWAVEAGARSIEHGVFLTEADAAAMAARGCFLVPTLAIYERLVSLAAPGGLDPGRAARAIEVGEHLGEAVRIARAAGVKVALGSDFGHRDDHGHNLSELALLLPSRAEGRRGALGGDLGGSRALRGRGPPRTNRPGLPVRRHRA